MSRDNIVSIAAYYRLDSPRIESQWGQDSAPLQTGTGVHPVSYAMGMGLFMGLKWPGHGVYPPTLIVPRLKKVYSYTSAPPLGLYSLSVGEVYVLPSVQKHAGE